MCEVLYMYYLIQFSKQSYELDTTILSCRWDNGDL